MVMVAGSFALAADQSFRLVIKGDEVVQYWKTGEEIVLAKQTNLSQWNFWSENLGRAFTLPSMYLCDAKFKIYQRGISVNKFIQIVTALDSKGIWYERKGVGVLKIGQGRLLSYWYFIPNQPVTVSDVWGRKISLKQC